MCVYAQESTAFCLKNSVTAGITKIELEGAEERSADIFITIDGTKPDTSSERLLLVVSAAFVDFHQPLP